MLRLAIFLSALFIIIAAGEAYIYRRIISISCAGIKAKIITRLILYLILFSCPAIITLQRFGFENSWIDAASWAGYLGLGFVSMLFTLLVLTDLLRFTWWGTRKFTDTQTAETDNENFSMERRTFLGASFNSALVMASGGLGAAGVYQAVRIPDIKQVYIPASNIPESLTKLKMIQISDIHASSTIKKPWIEKLVSKINSIEPDIVFLTGDLVDGSVHRLGCDVSPLSKIRAKLGKYFVTGNHEYYSGVLPWITEIKKLGFDVLLNSHRIIQYENASLLVAGVTDFRAGNFLSEHKSDPYLAIRNAPESDYKILLAHQPKSLFSAAEAGFDLQISGHTHGGQFFPWNFFVGLDQPVTAGLESYKNMMIYVSRGTGYWGPPMRLGAAPEITLIRLSKNHDFQKKPLFHESQN